MERTVSSTSPLSQTEPREKGLHRDTLLHPAAPSGGLQMNLRCRSFERFLPPDTFGVCHARTVVIHLIPPDCRDPAGCHSICLSLAN